MNLIPLIAAGSLAALCFGAAWLVSRRTRRIGGAPQVTPRDLFEGRVSEGTLVQLVGQVRGETMPAPWSRREAVTWCHTFGLYYKEDDGQGNLRDHSILIEQRHPNRSWGLGSGQYTIPVRDAEHLEQGWVDFAPSASKRWPVWPGRLPGVWEVEGAVIEPAPSWSWPPQGTSCEVTTSELVLTPGQRLVAVGRARRTGRVWELTVADRDGGLSASDARAVTRFGRNAARLLVAFGVVALVAGGVAFAVGASRDRPCAAVISPELSGVSPSYTCCIEATGRQVERLGVAVPRLATLALNPRGEPWVLALDDGPEAEVGVALIEPRGGPTEVRMRRADGQPLGRFCVLIQPR